MLLTGSLSGSNSGANSTPNSAPVTNSTPNSISEKHQLPIQQFNTPINLYSNEAAQEEFRKQTAQAKAAKEAPMAMYEEPAREEKKKKNAYADPDEIRNYQAKMAQRKADKKPYQPASFKMIEYMSSVPQALADKKEKQKQTASGGGGGGGGAGGDANAAAKPDYSKYLKYIEEDDGNEMNKLRANIAAAQTRNPENQTPSEQPTNNLKIPTQRPASPPTQPVIQQREKMSVSDEYIISNESLVRPSAARRAERMVSASPVPRMMTSPDPQSFYQTPMQKSYPDPSSYLVGSSQQQQQQPQQDVSYLHEDDDARAIDERGQFFNQPPVNFPSQNTKSGMDYFELQKLMHPTAAPRKRDVTPSRAYRSASGAGTPANVSANDSAKGEMPIYDTYLRHETAKNRKQFGGGGTSEFASANPVMPTNIVTDSRIGDDNKKNFKSGGSVPTFVPKNYVAPPNFGNARKMRQNSDSGLAPTYSNPRRIKRSSSLSNQPPANEAPPQPRRNLPRQSKIERNLAKSYGTNGGRGREGGAEDRPSSVMSQGSVMSSRSVSMSPAPSLQRGQQGQQVKFNPESHVIYYDDYDTMTEDDGMTEDEDDYELVFNDPMPNQQTGTYSFSFKHGALEEEAEERAKKALVNGGKNGRNNDNDNDDDDNKFKTISPPTYGDDGVREVPMDREIPIQRPRGVGDNNRARRNHHEGGGGRQGEEEDEDAASEAASVSPNASPTRQMAEETKNYVTEELSSGKSTASVSVSVKEFSALKAATQARRLVSPSPVHDSSSSETIFDNLD